MKSCINEKVQKVNGVTILEAIAASPRKLNNLVNALSVLGFTIDTSVQINDRKSAWIK